MKIQVVLLLISAVVQAQTRFKLSADDAGAGDNFGTSVSISGDRIVVGAPGEGDPHNKGKVYIFERSNGKWNAVATLVASDGEPNDQFGHSVATSGDRVIVGAPRQRIRLRVRLHLRTKFRRRDPLAPSDQAAGRRWRAGPSVRTVRLHQRRSCSHRVSIGR
jgi:FG-GAP repeat